MTITRKPLFLALLVITIVTAALSIGGGNRLNLTTLISLPYLMIVPGLLIALSLRLRAASAAEYLVQIVGLSLAYLLGLGLAVNELLPRLGVAQPLRSAVLWPALGISLALLAASAWWHCYHWRFEWHWPRPTGVEVGLLGAAAVVLACSVLGAQTLNNGGTAFWTLLGLGASTALVPVAVITRRRVSVNAWAGLIFVLALALLAMTSLRGWYITGHDIAREYQVFQLAARANHWNIAQYQDAYNACLSITILPTLLRNILHLPDLLIYKVLYQIIFAVCPVVVFLTVRRFASPVIAWLASIYFLAFPTFFGDMPMLARQEIAFVFLALMLLQLAKASRDAKQARFLLIIFGLGMVVSHYSTTYSVILVFGLALLARGLLRWFARLWRPQSSSAVPVVVTGRLLVTPRVVLLLALASFVWSVQLTHTGGGMVMIARQTVGVITGAVKDDLKSTDVNYSLFSHHAVDPQTELTSYVTKSAATALSRNPASTFYSSSSGQSLMLAPVASLPLTASGRWLGSLGLNVPKLHQLTRQLSAIGLQLLILVGLVAVIWRRRYIGQIHLEYLSLAIATMGFVCLQVILPFWSVEYGLLRAVQQSLMLLGVFAVIGSLVLTRRTRQSWKVSNGQLVFGALLASAFLASSTGLITQLLGGYPPQLHLNNSGAYYDLYYTHMQEVAAATWLGAIRREDPKSTTQSDRFNFTKIQSLSELDDQNDIIPPLVRRDSYVFLGYDNVRHGQSTVGFNGDLISYIYPRGFLDQTKDLIYSNGSSEIYR